MFPGRDLIIFLTFAVILVTLVVQGLTLTTTIRWLKLAADDTAKNEEAAARLKLAQTGLKRLNEIAKNESGADETVIKALRESYEHRVHRLQTNDPDEESLADKRSATAYRRLRLEIIARERREVIRLRDESEISDDVLRRIQEDLDFEEVLMSGVENRSGAIKDEAGEIKDDDKN